MDLYNHGDVEKWRESSRKPKRYRCYGFKAPFVSKLGMKGKQEKSVTKMKRLIEMFATQSLRVQLMASTDMQKIDIDTTASNIWYPSEKCCKHCR